MNTLLLTSLGIKVRRIISAGVALFFAFSTVFSPATTYAQGVLDLPPAGAMVKMSEPFQPAVLKGIKFDSNNALQFDFIVDKGDSGLEGAALEDEGRRLIKYFLTALTVPEGDLWVNLSPHESDRIIPDKFGLTEMGRDLLSEDYLLKQMTATMIDPQADLGQEFWKRVYERAQKEFGTTDIPIDTFNKVWIMPDKARIFEKGNSVYLVESRMKVMLEQDYVAMSHQKDMAMSPQGAESRAPARDLAIVNSGTTALENSEYNVSKFASDIVREVIIPELTREVNEGKNFARLRQVHNSLVLAAWYRQKVKASILGETFVGQNKIAGSESGNPAAKDEIYQQYLEAFKKGVYDYIKEDYDTYSQQMIPRKYFSGGYAGERVDFAMADELDVTQAVKGELERSNRSGVAGMAGSGVTRLVGFRTTFELSYPSVSGGDAAQANKNETPSAKIKRLRDKKKLVAVKDYDPVIEEIIAFSKVYGGDKKEYLVGKVSILEDGDEEPIFGVLYQRNNIIIERSFLKQLAANGLVDKVLPYYIVEAMRDGDMFEKSRAVYQFAWDKRLPDYREALPFTVGEIKRSLEGNILALEGGEYRIVTKKQFSETVQNAETVMNEVIKKGLLREASPTTLELTNDINVVADEMRSLLKALLPDDKDSVAKVMGLFRNAPAEITQGTDALYVTAANALMRKSFFKGVTLNSALGQEGKVKAPGQVRIGYYAIAGNPIHWGHLLVILRAMAEHKLSTIYVIIAGKDDRKQVLELTEFIRHAVAEFMLGNKTSESAGIFSGLLQYSSLSRGTNIDGEGNVATFVNLNLGVEGETFYLVGDDHKHLFAVVRLKDGRYQFKFKVKDPEANTMYTLADLQEEIAAVKAEIEEGKYDPRSLEGRRIIIDRLGKLVQIDTIAKIALNREQIKPGGMGLKALFLKREKHPFLEEERELIALMGLEDVINELSDYEFEASSSDVRKALINISEHKQLQDFFVKLFASYQGGVITNATIEAILKEMLGPAYEYKDVKDSLTNEVKNIIKKLGILPASELREILQNEFYWQSLTFARAEFYRVNVTKEDIAKEAGFVDVFTRNQRNRTGTMVIFQKAGQEWKIVRKIENAKSNGGLEVPIDKEGEYVVAFDAAQAVEMTDPLAQDLNYGGIDFGLDNVDLDIEASGPGIRLNFDPNMLRNGNFNGLTPVILNVTPISDLPLFLGAAREPEEELAGAGV